MHVLVKRNTWGRGAGVAFSRLLNPQNGMMCCMGFACLAAGMARHEISDVSTIRELTDSTTIPPGLHKFLEDHDRGPGGAHDSSSLYCWNDRRNITDSEREAEIIRLGKNYDLDFTFED